MKVNACLLGILLIFLNSLCFGQISFNSFTLEVGHRGFVATAISDMDQDNVDDIIRVSYYGDVSIAIQNFDGTFSITNVGTIVYESINYGSWSICVADINSDEINDFFVGNMDHQFLFTSTGVLSYTREKLDGILFAQGANFVDIDGDNDLDLFVCNDDTTNVVYENDGLGNFTLNDLVGQSSFYSGNYGSVWTDFDNDNDLDLYISKCKHGVTDSTDGRRINLLYRNEDSVYNEVAAMFGLDDGSQSWCADFADIDNDGDFDMIIANHGSFHRLYRNDGDTSYVKITSQAGIDEYTDAAVYQSLFADFDNDGWQDLILTNENNSKLIYQNDQDGTFTLVQDPFDVNQLYSISLGDLNNDGFIDMYSIRENAGAIVSDEIHLNNGNTNNYIGFVLMDSTPDFNAIGAKLKLYGAWGVQMKEIRSGESYGIHNSFQKIFGLGNEVGFDSLVVNNLDGEKCIFTSVNELNANYTIDFKDCSINKIVDTDAIESGLDIRIKVYSSKGKIIIENNDENNKLELFTIDGAAVNFQCENNDGRTLVTPLSKQKVYLVRINHRSYKIFVD